MIVKNLTSQKVTLTLKSIVGDHEEYSVCIVPYGFTEISSLEVISNRQELGAKISVEGESPVEVISKVESESIESPEEDAPEQLDSKFICEECGAEFASARSLSAHISRSHKE